MAYKVPKTTLPCLASPIPLLHRWLQQTHVGCSLLRGFICCCFVFRLTYPLSLIQRAPTHSSRPRLRTLLWSFPELSPAPTKLRHPPAAAPLSLSTRPQQLVTQRIPLQHFRKYSGGHCVQVSSCRAWYSWAWPDTWRRTAFSTFLSQQAFHCETSPL